MDAIAKSLADAILESPGDATIRLALADRLEELGQEGLAGRVRLRGPLDTVCKLTPLAAGSDGLTLAGAEPGVVSYRQHCRLTRLEFSADDRHAAGQFDVIDPASGAVLVRLAATPGGAADWRPTTHMACRGGVAFRLSGPAICKFSARLVLADGAVFALHGTLRGTPRAAAHHWLSGLFPGVELSPAAPPAP
jgi:uncharacterized protein (TIGR02996 family)